MHLECTQILQKAVSRGLKVEAISFKDNQIGTLLMTVVKNVLMVFVYS
jgi:uncharacterized protein YwbE